MPFKPQEGVSIQLLPEGKKIGKMLEEGEINALFIPHPPKEALRGSDNISRLFSHPKKEELAYFRKNDFYPIMHVVAFKEEVLKKDPWATMSVMEAFEKAKEACKEFYDDPNWSYLAWTRHLVEEERRIFGDAWPYGVAKNRANLEGFMGYTPLRRR